MNQRLRTLVLFSFILLSLVPLCASQAITVTRSRLSQGIGKAILMPFYLAQLPFAIGAELLFDKKIGQPSKELQLAKETPKTEPAPLTVVPEPVKAPTQLHTTQTAAPMVNIPQVVESVFAGIPKESTQPVFINVNVNTQQTAATSHSEATKSSESAKPSVPLCTAAPIEVHGATHYIAQAKKWVLEHKSRSAIACGAIIYGGLHLYLWHASYLLSKSEGWSLWKPDLFT